MFYGWRVLLIASIACGVNAEGETTPSQPPPTTPTTPTTSTTTTTTTSTSSTSTTTVTTQTPPSSFFPCQDVDTNSCTTNIKNDAKYCKKDSNTYAYARSNCCYSCAMKLGFTATKQKKNRNPNGSITIILINVVDFTSSAGQTWCALPTTNEAYPGLSKVQTESLCQKRSEFYTKKRFCNDPLARTVCGKTCYEYNYPPKTS